MLSIRWSQLAVLMMLLSLGVTVNYNRVYCEDAGAAEQRRPTTAVGSADYHEGGRQSQSGVVHELAVCEDSVLAAQMSTITTLECRNLQVIQSTTTTTDLAVESDHLLDQHRVRRATAEEDTGAANLAVVAMTKKTDAVNKGTVDCCETSTSSMAGTAEQGQNRNVKGKVEAGWELLGNNAAAGTEAVDKEQEGKDEEESGDGAPVKLERGSKERRGLRGQQRVIVQRRQGEEAPDEHLHSGAERARDGGAPLLVRSTHSGQTDGVQGRWLRESSVKEGEQGAVNDGGAELDTVWDVMDWVLPKHKRREEKAHNGSDERSAGLADKWASLMESPKTTQWPYEDGYAEEMSKKYPGLFRYWQRVSAPHRGKKASQPIDKKRSNLFMDSVPMFYPAPSERLTSICLNPKVGGTRWKALMLRAKGVENAAVGRRVHHLEVPWLQELKTLSAHTGKTSDKKNLRFMFVRNPYSRLLSGFLDKGILWAKLMKAQYSGPFKATPAEFKRFVKVLLARRRQKKTIDHHFELLSKACGLPAGFQYNFYLKVEEINVWYADLISLLGLGDAAAAGWAFSNDTNAPDCFLPLPGKSCAETTYAIRNHDTLVETAMRPGNITGGTAWMQGRTSGHSRGADKQLHEYFADPETRALASRFVKPDVNRFKYPVLLQKCINSYNKDLHTDLC